MASFPSRFIRGSDGTVYDTSPGYLQPLSSPQQFQQLSGTSDIQGGSTPVNFNLPSGQRFIRTPDGTVYDTSKGYLDPIHNPAQFQQLSGTSDIQGGSTLVQNLIPGNTNQPVTVPNSPSQSPLVPSQQSFTPDPAKLAQNIQDASVAPLSAADIAANRASLEGGPTGYAAQRAALSTDLEAKLKQRLQASDTSTQQDLSSRGFLRSGEQITRTDMTHTLAEADLALQQAGYLTNLNTQENADAATLGQQEMSVRQGNSAAQLQNQVTAMGMTQQEFTNMQTELTRLASLQGQQFGENLQTSTFGLTSEAQAFTQSNEIAKGMYQLQANPEFQSMVMYAKSDPNIAAQFKQMLIQMGFNLT